jgi:hypothetical protein
MDQITKVCDACKTNQQCIEIKTCTKLPIILIKNFVSILHTIIDNSKYLTKSKK